MVRYVILRRFLREIPPKSYFGILAHRPGSHHGEEIYEALKCQTWQSGSPFQNKNSELTIQLTLCRTITNHTLDGTTETIGHMTTTRTKKMTRLTTPKIPIKYPTPITTPPKKILYTSKRVSHVPVIPARSHAISSVKMSIV